MKKILLSMCIILSSNATFAADFGGAQIFEISKNNYSKNMFLILHCLSTQGLKMGDLAIDHCKGEATVLGKIPAVYDSLLSPIPIDLNKFHFTNRDMIVCLGGVRGRKQPSEDLAQQNNRDRVALEECETLLIPTMNGGSQYLYQEIQTQ